MRLPKTDRPIKPTPSNTIVTGSDIKLVFLIATDAKIPDKTMVEVTFIISPPNLTARCNLKMQKGWYRQIK